MFELFRVGFVKSGVRSDLRCAIDVVLAIHRTSLITVQPCAIGSESNQISEWKLVVIKVSHKMLHCMRENDTPSLTVGLLPRADHDRYYRPVARPKHGIYRLTTQRCC